MTPKRNPFVRRDMATKPSYDRPARLRACVPHGRTIAGVECDRPTKKTLSLGNIRRMGR